MHKVNSAIQWTKAVQGYIALAIDGLPQMFNEESGLFCYSLKKSNGALVPEGLSHRYTMMTLLGLDQVERSGGKTPLELKPILDRLLAQTEWVTNIGDLGVLLWTCAALAPERLTEVGSRLRVSTALARYAGAKDGKTMELAWFLTGICHWGLARPNELPALRELAYETYQRLKGNQGEHGFFGHAARTGVRGKTLGWLGSYADQVYPIYAYAKFALAYQHQGAAREAMACADAICQAQGPLGQWCWHYDSNSDRVVEAYPAFSVHQHAMGPMSLFALEEVTGADFSEPIYKGLGWIKSNELSVDMEDRSANVIWRCIGRPRLKRMWDLATNRGTAAVAKGDSREVRILFECRPYELGWLLYAFAGKVRPECQDLAQACADLSGISSSSERRSGPHA